MTRRILGPLPGGPCTTAGEADCHESQEFLFCFRSVLTAQIQVLEVFRFYFDLFFCIQDKPAEEDHEALQSSLGSCQIHQVCRRP